MENDAEKRSILISGITQELNIESILNAFSDFNVTGGGVIQSYEFYSSSRMRITYFYQKGRYANLLLIKLMENLRC